MYTPTKSLQRCYVRPDTTPCISRWWCLLLVASWHNQSPTGEGQIELRKVFYVWSFCWFYFQCHSGMRYQFRACYEAGVEPSQKDATSITWKLDRIMVITDPTRRLSYTLFKQSTYINYNHHAFLLTPSQKSSKWVNQPGLGHICREQVFSLAYACNNL